MTLRQGATELPYAFNYLSLQSVREAAYSACSHAAIGRLLGAAIAGIGGTISGRSPLTPYLESAAGMLSHLLRSYLIRLASAPRGSWLPQKAHPQLLI